MSKIIALALLAVGIGLLIFGIQASESLGSQISEMFSGQPTDRAMGFIVAGIAATALGIGAMLIPRRA